MDNEKGIEKKYKVIYGGLFLLTGLVVFAFSYVLGKSYEAILRNTIVALIIAGCDIFMVLDACSREREGFSYDNYDNKMRFIIGYLGVLILSCVFVLVPNQLWPYMALFVILALFSNNEIGMVSGIGFVTISVMLEEKGEFGELFMYVLAGAVALSMFRDLKESTQIGFPTAISLMMQAVLLVAFNVLFQNRTLSFNVLALPIINLMLNLIILLVFLNMFGVYIIRKSNDRYMDINDPEFPLLVQLKEKSKDEYFRAVHTAIIAERVATGLDFNSRAVKTCAYYHRIGVIENKNKWEDLETIYTENSFPLEAVEFLHEYIAPAKGQAKSGETLIVVLSETIIASIMKLIRENKDVKIDYDKLIDSIFDKKNSDGEFNRYDVTFFELDQMKKLFKKEKLYYDFLR